MNARSPVTAHTQSFLLICEPTFVLNITNVMRQLHQFTSKECILSLDSR